jgi:hypothetical protein
VHRLRVPEASGRLPHLSAVFGVVQPDAEAATCGNQSLEASAAVGPARRHTWKAGKAEKGTERMKPEFDINELGQMGAPMVCPEHGEVFARLTGDSPDRLILECPEEFCELAACEHGEWVTA